VVRFWLLLAAIGITCHAGRSRIGLTTFLAQRATHANAGRKYPAGYGQLKDRAMSFRALALALPALALLAGCATSEEPAVVQPAPAPAVVAPPPAPTTSFDGRYMGHMTRARGAARTCRSASLPAHATVQAGRVSLNLGRGAPLVGVLDEAGNASLTGVTLKASPTALTGEALRGECRYTLTLRKRR